MSDEDYPTDPATVLNFIKDNFLKPLHEQGEISKEEAIEAYIDLAYLITPEDISEEQIVAGHELSTSGDAIEGWASQYSEIDSLTDSEGDEGEE